VWVEEIVGPGPDAMHSRSEFLPDAAYQQAQIAAAYERAGRRTSYLGDWHTHPGQRVYMSRRDRRTLRSIARCEPACQPRPVMAILGSAGWEMIVWRYERPKAGWWRRAQLNSLKTVIMEQ
jgi:integrative and conjugative element protein (TIGR02256 family)